MTGTRSVSEGGCREELFVLKLSAVLTGVYGITGIVIAVMCDSMTLMLDGLYGVVDIFVSFFAIAVVRKVSLPPDEKYPFGYAKYEPVMTAVDGILIVAICAATVFSSVQDLIHPEPMANLRLAVGYSFVSFFVCAGFGTYMKRAGKRCRSVILTADAQLWVIEGVISLGVFAAFGLTEYISRTYWERYADYVDPVLCILLAGFLLAKPVRIIRESFFDLVDASPRTELKEEIVRLAHACAEEHRLHGVRSVKVRKAGRRIFAVVHFEADRALSLDHTEGARRSLIGKVATVCPEADVTVLFSGR
ncbi:MAG: cation diffusion facilitator family transporter [Candidatus Omnitrophica bacterium]|nr:cation diffusion facilitator family transporter [Candidatus Omnitrophota bacterium]